MFGAVISRVFDLPGSLPKLGKIKFSHETLLEDLQNASRIAAPSVWLGPFLFVGPTRAGHENPWQY